MPEELSLKTRVLNGLRRVFQLPMLERLLARFTQGSSVESIWGRLCPNHYQYAPGTMRRVETPEGLTFLVDLGTLHGWVIYFGLRDPALEKLYRMIRPGMHIIDVGANIGEVCLRMAHRTGPEGRVLAFEPFPETWDMLQANLKSNPAQQVTAERLALGDVCSTVGMESPDPTNAGRNRIVAGATDSGDGPRVSVAPLDEYLQDNPLDRLDLIKIDVEGFEARVLKGARHTIVNQRPIVFLELDDSYLRMRQSSIAEIMAFFDGIDYEVVRALTDEPLDSREEFSAQHFDAVARPRAKT